MHQAALPLADPWDVTRAANHRRAWRRWRDFGGGAQGDMAGYMMDVVFTGLELTSPQWLPVIIGSLVFLMVKAGLMIPSL